jgi:transposase
VEKCKQNRIKRKRKTDIDRKSKRKPHASAPKNTSRAAFLSDKSHQVVFVYTPKHCSWLNQIECWFSIITRRLLNKRAYFKSVAELEQKIWEFIRYYNQFLKKPFKWNFKGDLLNA